MKHREDDAVATYLPPTALDHILDAAALDGPKVDVMIPKLTATEVAALSGLDDGRVHKDIEEGIFTRPKFGFADLVYFAVLAELDVALDADGRRKLHDSIATCIRNERVTPPAEIDDTAFLERLDRVTAAIRTRHTRFTAWKKTRVLADHAMFAGEPFLADSYLPVRQIGERLLRGDRVEDVRKDHPTLSDDDVVFAPIYARAYPRARAPGER